MTILQATASFSEICFLIMRSFVPFFNSFVLTNSNFAAKVEKSEPADNNLSIKRNIKAKRKGSRQIYYKCIGDLCFQHHLLYSNSRFTYRVSETCFCGRLFLSAFCKFRKAFVHAGFEAAKNMSDIF